MTEEGLLGLSSSRRATGGGLPPPDLTPDEDSGFHGEEFPSPAVIPRIPRPCGTGGPHPREMTSQTQWS